MTFFILCVSLLVLVTVGAFKLQTWNSGRHMINAEWLDDDGKFELIARWGA